MLPDAVAQGYLELLDELYCSGKAYSSVAAKFVAQTTPGGPIRSALCRFRLPADDRCDRRRKRDLRRGLLCHGACRRKIHRRALVYSASGSATSAIGTTCPRPQQQTRGSTLQVSRAGYGTVDKAAETITIARRSCNAPGIRLLAGVLHFRVLRLLHREPEAWRDCDIRRCREGCAYGRAMPRP